MSEPVSIERLRSLFDYDPDTGSLVWKARTSNRVTIGSRAPNIDSKGYSRVGVDRRQHRVHRIIWALYYGAWPLKQIDHINCDRTDNRITNLRLATESQNKANRRKNKNNTTGHKGVTKMKRGKPFSAQITHNRRAYYLGTFNTADEAVDAYAKAAERLFGSYSRTK